MGIRAKSIDKSLAPLLQKGEPLRAALALSAANERLLGRPPATPEDFLARVGSNTGNALFEDALRWQFPDLDVISWGQLSTSPDEISDNYDLLMVGFSNQLAPNIDFGWFGEILERAGVPVIGIGLGQQAYYGAAREWKMQPGTLRWLSVMTSLMPEGLSSNILSRGETSSEALNTLGIPSTPFGCPSMFINQDPLLGKSIAGRAGEALSTVVVLAGHSFWKDVSGIEQRLVKDSVFEGTLRSWVVQSDAAFLRLARGRGELSPEDLESLRSYLLPGQSHEVVSRFVKKYARAPFAARSLMDEMSSADFSIGCRFHGVMASIQAGTPGLVIIRDSRMRELCESTGVPGLSLKDIDEGASMEELRDKACARMSGFDEVRANLSVRYRSYFEQVGLTPVGLPG
jgi:hypothetical protein